MTSPYKIKVLAKKIKIIAWRTDASCIRGVHASQIAKCAIHLSRVMDGRSFG